MEQVYTKGFESLLSDFQHVLKIQAGFEALHEEINFDGPLGDDVEYANTVLKLNDLDLKEVAGQETFLDGLKKAGNKIKEFIKQLIVAIRSFFKPKEADVKEVESFLKSIRNKSDWQDFIKEATDLATAGTIPASVAKAPSTGNPLSDFNRHRKEKAEKVRDRVRRLSPEEKSAVSEASQAITQNADVQDKAMMMNDNIRLRVNSTINRFAKSANTALGEINRIDPTKETGRLLKMDISAVEKSIKRLIDDSENTSTDIENNIALLCDSRSKLSDLKDTATRELELMSSRGDYDDRVLSRATAVVQELVKAVESICNGVLSVDATIRKTEGEVIDRITKAIFVKAAGQMGGDVSKALSELNSIAGM